MGELGGEILTPGSDTTLGNRALQKAMGKRGVAINQTTLHSVTGQTMLADIAYANRLDMQGLSITRPTIAYSDSPPFAHLGLDKKPAILLGMREMRVFPRVAIDFKARKVLFDLPDGGDPAYFGPNMDGKLERIGN